MYGPSLEILKRVVAISCDKQFVGSAFAFPVNGFYVLATAAHVVGTMINGVENTLHIFKDNTWASIPVTPYFVRVPRHVDMALIKTSVASVDHQPYVDFTQGQPILGQDVFFIGFPYFGKSISYSAVPVNHGLPFPMVKKASLASIHDPIVFLDGHNNPGFSGGPIVYWDHHLQQEKILGLVTGYLNQAGKVGNDETSTALFYQENSGIAIGYHIKYVLNLIQNYIG